MDPQVKIDTHYIELQRVRFFETLTQKQTRLNPAVKDKLAQLEAARQAAEAQAAEDQRLSDAFNIIGNAAIIHGLWLNAVGGLALLVPGAGLAGCAVLEGFGLASEVAAAGAYTIAGSYQLAASSRSNVASEYRDQADALRDKILTGDPSLQETRVISLDQTRWTDWTPWTVINTTATTTYVSILLWPGYLFNPYNVSVTPPPDLSGQIGLTPEGQQIIDQQGP